MRNKHIVVAYGIEPVSLIGDVRPAVNSNSYIEDNAQDIFDFLISAIPSKTYEAVRRLIADYEEGM